MIRFFLTLIFVLLVVAGCRSNPAAYDASFANKAVIGSIHLGQSMEQVQAIMGKAPESVDARLLENGVSETVWYYLTDYGNETNTAITFHNDKVVAIATSKWLGNGTFFSRKSK